MRNYFWGFLLVAVGTLLLLDHLNVVDFEEIIHDYWPLLLILWGMSILIGRKRHSGTPPATAPVVTTESQRVEYDLLHQSSVFGDIYASVTSSNFKGGSVSTVFGNAIIDLSKTTFASGEHIMRLHGVFGDTTLILPKDAAVSVSANSVFGGLSIWGQRKEGISNDIKASTPNYDSTPNRLKISVTKVFGNVRID